MKKDRATRTQLKKTGDELWKDSQCLCPTSGTRLQTPLPFQLWSAQYSPLYPADKPCSVADTKTVRSLTLLATLVI